MRAANAVATNFPPPPEERRPVRETEHSYPWSTAAAGAVLRHVAMQMADYNGVFFIFAPAPQPRILAGNDVWRIDCLLAQNLHRNGCIPASKLLRSSGGGGKRGSGSS